MEIKNRLKSGFFICLGAASCLALGFTFGKLSGEINPASIEGASDLIGISFSPAEKDSMVNTLKNQLNNLENSRKISLDNSVAPSLVFKNIIH